jgi:TolB protein
MVALSAGSSLGSPAQRGDDRSQATADVSSAAARPASADDILVEYRLVHEELDGAADSGVSADGKWISFSHRRSGNRDVWAVNTDTGELRNLTQTPEDDWEARFNPEGTHIVFTGNRNGQNGVFVRNLETGEETTVLSTKDGYEDYPSFSRDGRRVTFTAGPMGYREVHTWNWDNFEVKPVTRGHDYVGSTGFDPTGELIVYHAYYGNYSSERADVYIVDANGGRGANITEADNVWVYKAQWSWDGEWIVMSARYDSTNFNLWVIRPDGSDLTKITDVDDREFRWADWTRDGRLAWHGIQAQQGRLMAMDIETGNRVEITHNEGYIRGLSASPGNELLAYESDGEIFVLRADRESDAHKVAEGTEPRWSPDGTTIAFLRGRGSRIATVSVKGGEPVEVDQEIANWPSLGAAWSPDGKTLAVVGDTDDSQEIMLIADGWKRVLTDSTFDKGSAAWSNDGRWVFYTENEPNRVGYYITTESVTDKLNRLLPNDDGKQ